MARARVRRARVDATGCGDATRLHANHRVPRHRLVCLESGGVDLAGHVALGLPDEDAFDAVGEAADAQARILAVLRARRRAVVDAIVRETHRQLPAMWRMRAPSIDTDLRISLHALLGMFIAVVDEDRALSREEVAAIRHIGMRRARQGIPAEVMAAAVRIAGEAGWHELVRSAQALPSAAHAIAALGRLGPLLVSFVEQTGRALADAYPPDDDEARAADPRAALVADVLTGPAFATDAEVSLLDRGRDAGIDLAAGWSVNLVSRPSSGDDWNGMREMVGRLLLRPGALVVPVAAASRAHTVVLLPSAGGRGHHEILEVARGLVGTHPAVVLSCPPERGPRRLRRQYLRAVQLLGMVPGARLAPGVYELADLRLDSLLIGGSVDHDDFLRETLGPILQLPEATRRGLLEMVRALATAPVSGGNRAVAVASAVHEKTVRRRLDRIHELTGLDADHPGHRTQLLLGQRLLELGGQGSG